MQTFKRIPIVMPVEEVDAWRAIAKDEMRDLRDHLRYVLREKLIRQGKLPAQRQAAPELATEEQWQSV